VVLCACWTGCSIGNNDGHWDVDQRFTTEVETHPANMNTQVRHRYEILAFITYDNKQYQKEKKDFTLANFPVLEIDMNEHPDLVIKWKVTEIPTYIAIRDGKEIFRHTVFWHYIPNEY
jgi:hypothetical protein